MSATAFRSGPLPDALAKPLASRLSAVHRETPLAPDDVRGAARRTAEIVSELGWDVTVYRGGLDLRGMEVDHVWLAVTDAEKAPGDRWVVDTAFPLGAPRFVATLRRFVTGECGVADLVAAAEGTALGDRVLGLVPTPMRYLGAPVWSARA